MAEREWELRIGSIRGISANHEDEEAPFSYCPGGTIRDTAGGLVAEVHCWRTGEQPSGIGIEVNASEEEGRSLAYAAMAEVAGGRPLSEFHIFYTDGHHEFIQGSFE